MYVLYNPNQFMRDTMNQSEMMLSPAEKYIADAVKKLHAIQRDVQTKIQYLTDQNGEFYKKECGLSLKNQGEYDDAFKSEFARDPNVILFVRCYSEYLSEMMVLTEHSVFDLILFNITIVNMSANDPLRPVMNIKSGMTCTTGWQDFMTKYMENILNDDALMIRAKKHAKKMFNEYF